MENENIIKKAVDIAGGITAMATFCGVSPPAVCKWIAKQQAPANRCIQIEKATKKGVTRYQLRPDVFGNR